MTVRPPLLLGGTWAAAFAAAWMLAIGSLPMAGTASAASLSEAPLSAAPHAQPAWLAPVWERYKAAFVRDGRVVDNANGAISHSEGQGYAMLIAVRADDRRTFDDLFAWTKRTLMVREDGLVAWRFEPAAGGVTDRNNATDGDVLIAWALLEAAERWRVGSYADEARRLALAIGNGVFVETSFGPALLPGAHGFTEADQVDGPVLNLSYWIWPAFDVLAGIAPELPWRAVEETGLRLLEESRWGLLRLPANWIALGGERPAPASAFPVRFGYDAIRLPLYLAWGGRDGRHLEPFRGLWVEEEGIGPYEIDLTTSAAIEEMGGAGFKAVAALTDCALDGRAFPAALREVPIENYYPTTLHILALFAVEERYSRCL